MPHISHIFYCSEQLHCTSRGKGLRHTRPNRFVLVVLPFRELICRDSTAGRRSAQPTILSTSCGSMSGSKCVKAALRMREAVELYQLFPLKFGAQFRSIAFDDFSMITKALRREGLPSHSTTSLIWPYCFSRANSLYRNVAAMLNTCAVLVQV